MARLLKKSKEEKSKPLPVKPAAKPVVKPAKETGNKKPAPAPAKKQEETVVQAKHTFPEKIASKNSNVTYVRLDTITYEELQKKVAEGVNYPIRMLMREDREDRKVTEFAVCHVGKWVTCVDLNSTGVNEGSGFRFNKEEFAAREAAGFNFDIFEIVPNAVTEDKPPVEDKAPAKKKPPITRKK